MLTRAATRILALLSSPQIWVRLKSEPTAKDQELVKEVFKAWYTMGRLSAYNGMNLQVRRREALCVLAALLFRSPQPCLEARVFLSPRMIDDEEDDHNCNDCDGSGAGEGVGKHGVGCLQHRFGSEQS